MKAYRTKLYGITSIVFAETAARARSATLRAARDAGYEGKKYFDVESSRAPEFDGRLTIGGSIAQPLYCHDPDMLRSDRPR